MANKLNMITQMYENTLYNIAKTPENWIEFLKSATWNFGYNFSDKICIYAQRPDAKACTTMGEWNKKAKRWINSNAKGIALIKETNGIIGLKYVFDVSDTHQYNRKEYKLWEVKPEYHEEIIESLEERFGELETKNSLAESIYSAACIAVEDNIGDYLDDLKSYIEDSFLEELDDDTISYKLRVLLNNSVTFMMMQRCNIDPMEYFTSDDFRDIVDFNSYDTIIRVGNSASDIAEMGITEIKRTVQNLQKQERNTNRTFERNNNKDYAKGKEGSESYANNISKSRGISNTRFNIGEEKQESEFREIRNNEVEFLKREQESSISITSNERPIDRTFIRDRFSSNNEIRTNNERLDTKTEHNRRNESTRPNEVVWVNEQLENDSGGTSNTGIDIQLEEPIIAFPSIAEQINSIDEAEVEENTSVFTFSQEMIDNCLKDGSGFESGKYRIFEQFEKSLSSKENIIFLKNEYGIGGSSSISGFDGIGQWHDSKGIKLNKGYGENAPTLLLTWNKVEQRIKELIKLDRYLNSYEKEHYSEWLEEQEQKRQLVETEKRLSAISKEDSFAEEFNKFLLENDIFDTSEDDLSDEERLDNLRNDLQSKSYLLETISYLGEVRSAEDGDEELQKEIDYYVERLGELAIEQNPNEYDFRVGDTVYIGTDEYEINSIGIANVSLYDPKYPLFGREMSLEEFERKAKENPANNHLKQTYRTVQELKKEIYNPIEKPIVQEPKEDSTIIQENIIEPTIEPEINVEQTEEKIVPQFEKKKVKKVNEFNLHPEISIEDRNQYVIQNNDLGVGTPKEKYRRNIEAIKVLKQCENESRYATSEEQEILAGYVGWGGLPEAFDDNNSSWANEYVELKNILSEEEYESARASTLTAFYTPPTVIKNIYRVIENAGLTEGNVLEPSCGIGNFIGMLPDKLQNLKLYGVEIDTITGGIARQLYQKSSIAVEGYENTNLPDSFFDAAIGNVPFGDFKVADKRYDKNKFMIHDYFFAKTLDKVRPGGVIAFISSKGTMDKENPSVRKYIAQRADLLGAIRLPDNTFKDNAGTKVTSDIIFLQKRDHILDIEPDWVNLATDENGITMNKYFVDNPDMILGEMVMESTRFGMDSTCKANENESLDTSLLYAINNIHANIGEYDRDEDIEELEDDNWIPAEANVRNFSYTVVDNQIYYRVNSKMYPQELPLTSVSRIKGMIAIRDCVRNLIEFQTEDFPDEDIKGEQIRLNTLYDDFTKKYGLINSRANNIAFREDSSYYLLCSLEVVNENGELIRKADMFSKRTIKPHREITKVDTSREALIASISEKAKVDLNYMHDISGIDIDKIIEDLEGEIFNVPEYGNPNNWVTADEYLSGNVREKLKVAEHFTETDDKFKINVEKLKQVIPKDLSASEISVKLGATWIPQEIVQRFIFELLDTPNYARWNIKVHYSDFTAEWNIEGKSYDRTNVKAYNTYGTSRVNAYKIIEDTLNLKDTKVFDTIINDDGSKSRVLNKQETAIAQMKQDQIKSAFEEWLWNNPDRREKLVRIYNDKFNSIRPREYDGSNLQFNGMNPEISLRPHQVNAIAHILYGGNTLLAHEVGAGKTFEMVAAAMESKRLGLCNKSLFVVPNHIIEQFASEFLQLYPSANILVATKKDFATNNRKRFCSKIATGEYDAIIIGHSQFEKIPMSVERQVAILNEQIRDIINGITEMKANHGERFSIKQLEKSKRKLEDRLKKLNDQSRKDDVVTFEELGCDRIFVDEAHYFKNMFLYTKMRNVGGIAQTEAQKSSDLFMKCRYLDEITGGKGIVFATGTPISNSMVEMYTMQRYLQYGTLQKNNLQHFDCWASTFGETVTAIELAPEGTGYRAKTRFAKFHNLPELMSMFKEIADIQTSDMLNLPVPKANYHTIVVEPSETQKQMVADLADRAERVRNKMVDSSTDNMLKITNDGRKLALDQRLANELLEDYDKSKTAICSQNIYDIWKKNEDKKLAQLVFCDLSTPHNDGKFNVYDDLRKKLIEKGIPEKEIAFIHDADTEVKKKELFTKVRKGEVRVLMGSTQKMGAGTNCQDKLIALHHLDCPWRPSDLIQRCGRIIRQGNQNPEVDIYTYVTEGTFDGYLYQLVENKQKFISQIMTSKTPVRVAEDIDEKALSYAEIKALAAGNPLIIEKTELDTSVSKLRLLKQTFLNQVYEIQDKVVKYYPNEIARLEKRITLLGEDIERAKQNTKTTEDNKFSPMTLGDTIYTERQEAGKQILELCKTMKNPSPIHIGDFRGFSMELYFETVAREFRINLKGTLSHTVSLGDDASGNTIRIDNVLDNLKKELENTKVILEDTKMQFENAKIESQKEFPQEQELKNKIARLEQVNKELNLNEKEHEIIENDEPDEKSQERDFDKER